MVDDLLRSRGRSRGRLPVGARSGSGRGVRPEQSMPAAVLRAGERLLPRGPDPRALSATLTRSGGHGTGAALSRPFARLSPPKGTSLAEADRRSSSSGRSRGPGAGRISERLGRRLGDPKSRVGRAGPRVSVPLLGPVVQHQAPGGTKSTKSRLSVECLCEHCGELCVFGFHGGETLPGKTAPATIFYAPGLTAIPLA